MSHPHIRQATKIIDGKPVIYSLGNVVFDGFSDADNNTGSILWMTVTAVGVKDWHLQAVHIDRSGSPHPERVAVRPVQLGKAGKSFGLCDRGSSKLYSTNELSISAVIGDQLF